MADLHHKAFPADPGPIGAARDGRGIELRPMTREAASPIGTVLAAIDPWARVARTPEHMIAFLADVEEGARRYRIMVGGQNAGAMVVRVPWLHGPYLHLIGLAPEFHGAGVGGAALGWLEAAARGRYRNLWLCVSAFNVRARRLYEANGYRLAATLDALVFDGMDELLMRKRLA